MFGSSKYFHSFLLPMLSRNFFGVQKNSFLNTLLKLRILPKPYSYAISLIDLLVFFKSLIELSRRKLFKNVENPDEVFLLKTNGKIHVVFGGYGSGEIECKNINAKGLGN